ncbi:MAG: hypothetical protein JEZ11_16260 [Desulfobacterales bacterium]|nr:hypothetical protein [Desulfobacterales bacterium]
MKEIEVVVNKPDSPIVLALMAYDPVIWKVKQSRRSRILAVIVGGYHTQALLGLPKDIPKIFAVHEEKESCPYFYAYKGGTGLDKAVERIHQITGKELAQLLTDPIENRFYIGSQETIDPSSLVYSSDTHIDEYLDMERPPVGQKGLDLLVKQGKIRLASRKEIDAWVDKASAKSKRYNKKILISHHIVERWTYLVLDNFELPDGLAGAHSRAFIIPEGKNLPTGPRGHNSFYLMSTGTFMGTAPECH